MKLGITIKRPDTARMHGNWFWIVHTVDTYTTPYRQFAYGFAWTRKGADKKAQRAADRVTRAERERTEYRYEAPE